MARSNQLDLRGFDAQPLLTQKQDRFAKPAVSGLLTDPSSPGGPLETTPLLYRSQEPNPDSRIPL